MRQLRRNTTEFEYFPHGGVLSDLNDDGEHTGEMLPDYGEAVTYRGSISSPSGHTVHQFYGEDVRYTHTLVMDRADVPIDEHGLIRWKGHMYEITAVRPSLNFFSAALKRMPDEPEESDDSDEPDEPDEPDGDGD